MAQSRRPLSRGPLSVHARGEGAVARVWAAGALATGAILLAACGPLTSAAGHRSPGRVGSAPRTSGGCLTTVRGVVAGPGSLAAKWLPTGFRRTSGMTSDPRSGLTYSADGPNPPRIELALSNGLGPLSAAAGGRVSATDIEVQGHHALLEEGPPDPHFIGVYWKPTASDLLSVVGYKLPAQTVVAVAQHVRSSLPRIVHLPVQPGPIVTKAVAVTAAREASDLPRSQAQAKLSSWTEISALLRADHAAGPFGGSHLQRPWKPVWAVLLSETSPNPGSVKAPGKSSSADLVVVDAASGEAVTAGRVARHAWFAALTNREPSLGGCPGGSTARLPFGVLTRDEEAYVVASSRPSPQAATRSVILKLTTVPALNKADPGLYGGCVLQSCSLDQLVWPTIIVVHALAGKTLACLPPSASHPSGYRPKRVHEYVTIGVVRNSAIVCGPLPTWVRKMRDLAPPASG